MNVLLFRQFAENSVNSSDAEDVDNKQLTGVGELSEQINTKPLY